MIVYWIRKTNHTDIMTQGYVGITANTLEERVRGHRKNKGNSIVAGKLRKNANLVATVMHNVDTLEEALKIEAYYRPAINIGWNLQKGGEMGVDPSWYDNDENKLKHSMKTSEATRRGIAIKDTTEARSKRASATWECSERLAKGKAAATGENNSRAILTKEDVVRIKYELIPAGLKNPEIAQIFDVKPYLISFIRTGKNWKDV